MADLQTRIFRLEQVKDAFHTAKAYGGSVLIDIDWLHSTSLSETLNQQVKKNLLIHRQLDGICSNDGLNRVIVYNFEKNTGLDLDSVDKQQFQRVCNTHKKNVRNFYDVLSRDQDAFELVQPQQFKIPQTVDLQVLVVLTSAGNYVGHVYFWISPVDTSLLFMIGIRSRPDMAFLRLVGEGVNNLAVYILDQIEKFAIDNGVSKIIIPHPIGVMKDISIKAGFNLDKTVSGKSIGYTGKLTRYATDFSGNCDKCVSKSIKPPAQEDPRLDAIKQFLISNNARLFAKLLMDVQLLRDAARNSSMIIAPTDETLQLSGKSSLELETIAAGHISTVPTRKSYPMFTAINGKMYGHSISDLEALDSPANIVIPPKTVIIISRKLL